MRSRLPKLAGVVAALALMVTGCFPVPRTSEQVELAGQGRIDVDGTSHSYQFFRNDAYRCGRSGVFTFLIIEPPEDGAEAPLWIYLHGGGTGYYDDDGAYVGDETSNDEESKARLLNKSLDKHLRLPDGAPKDTTLSRRLRKGYRVLLPSMCDHDLHAGRGTPYPNNPNGLGPDGGGVNGLQANLSALDHTVANRPTGNVFVHGTSAGSVGAWALSYSLAREGVQLNGAILDSYLLGPRTLDLFEAGVTTQQAKYPEFDPRQVQEKVKYFTRNAYVVDEISEGWRSVPLFVLTGELDPLCGGTRKPIDKAVEAGYDNTCRYWQGGVADAIAAQPDSPHVAYVADGGDHSPSIDPDPVVHDRVDEWLDAIHEAGAPEPFEA